jgi:hypothetical protein
MIGSGDFDAGNLRLWRRMIDAPSDVVGDPR